MDGTWQMGHMNAEDYTKKAREASKLMMRTSPDIKLIAAGSSNYREGSDLFKRTCLLLDRILADIRVREEMWRIGRSSTKG